MKNPAIDDVGTGDAAESFSLDPNQDGRDEMNLSEYPIALLADRAPKDVKTLVYKDRDETLTITGSDYLGLPTALDIDVIIGLLHLTKKKNDFTERTLTFTRYELLQVLRWPDTGRYYQRITESLNRWVGVTLIYKKAWWDNDKKSKGNASFHIVDAANVVERDDSTSRQHQLPLSTIRWGEEFFRSCQANNLKRLDLGVYFSLGSSISKQLYRFLDKRFYKRPVWTFDLRTLACEHVGLSRNYPSWKLKQKLEPAIEELTEAGFLRRMEPQERYQRVARGEWSVTLAKASSRILRPPERAKEAEPTPLERKLIDRGVSEGTARELVAEYPGERITAQVEHFDWLKAKHPKKITKSPGGFLAEAIRKDYPTPSGFETAAQRAVREEVRREQQRQETKATRKRQEAKAAELEGKAQVDAYLKAHGPAELERLDAEALEAAEPEVRASIEQTSNPTMRRLHQRLIRESHVRRILGLPEPTED